jgi:hypothetical protein
VLIAIILVAVVILGGIAVVAMGFGGELARSPRNEPSYPYFQTAEDVAAYRPPAALLGYDARTTEYAFRLAGEAIADRDAEIAALAARLSDLEAGGDRRDDDWVSRPAAAGEAGPAAVSPRARRAPHVPAASTAPSQPMSAEAASRWESRLTGERTGMPGPVTLHEEDQ